jgi:6-pyruvoyltetrahydropterin/6-carboxytetrahydropterin synthase
MHRIPRHESKCAAFHGHRYVAEVTCEAPALDSLGRVIDFGVLKEVLGTWIDTHWDHTAILMRDDPDEAVVAIAKSNQSHGRPVYFLDVAPSAENLVAELARVGQELLQTHGVQLVRIRLWETPNSSAEWSR